MEKENEINLEGLKFIEHKYTGWRAVEAQHKVVTRRLKDSLVEHLNLEELLDHRTVSESTSSKLHYLLSTPFRYPPLKYGSRFGTRKEKGIFYGSLDLSTAMAEVAYYRFLFITSILNENEIYGDDNAIYTDFTFFKFEVSPKKFVSLINPFFLSKLNKICSPTDYKYSQKLGKTLKKMGVDAICYPSARNPRGGLETAIFKPVFSTNKPLSFKHIHCKTTSKLCEFIVRDENQSNHSYKFNIEDFYFKDEIRSVESTLETVDKDHDFSPVLGHLRVFISYKRSNDQISIWVKKFCDDLRNLGIDAKLDKYEMKFGDSVSKKMTTLIREADAFIFVITSDSVTVADNQDGKGALNYEIQLMNDRRMNEGIPIIGLLKDGDKLPGFLADNRYADFRSNRNYKNSLEELVSDLLGKTGPPPINAS